MDVGVINNDKINIIFIVLRFVIIVKLINIISFKFNKFIGKFIVWVLRGLNV